MRTNVGMAGEWRLVFELVGELVELVEAVADIGDVISSNEELESLVDVLSRVVEFVSQPAWVSDAVLEFAENVFICRVEVVCHSGS